MADSRSNVPCRFFAWGKCRSGLSCPFSHDGPLVQSSPTETWQRRQQEKSDVGKKADTDMTKDGDDKEDKDDFTRAMAGASVRFEDGGRVAKVSLPEDFSAVQLSSLPSEGVSAESVRAFLGGLGVSVAITDVRLLPHGDAAVVRAEDATFSRRVCAHMAAGSRWGSSVVRAVRVAAPMPKDHTAGRVDCRKVHISWHKPVRTAWLRFGSERTAQRVSRAFSAGVYRVLDQKVVAGEPERTVSTRGGYRTVAAEWTVRLSDLPAAADTRDVISRAIGKPADRPLSIEVSQPTYQAAPGSRISSTGDQDEDYCAAIVRSLLGQSGTVEYWETTLESTAKRVKATARFLDEADARAAATQLNGSRLPFHANGRLTVQLVCSVRFKVGSSVYDALAPRISALAGSAWKTAHVRFFAYPSPRLQPAYRILKLEGESDRAVAVAKGELDRILAGTVARDRQEKPLWDEAISSSNSLWLEIQRQARSDSPDSLIVVRSKTRSQMLLFGSQAACDHAQTRLRALLLDNEKTSHTIPLQPNQFLWACREGLASIADRIGPGKASLDVVSTPKQICIQGSLHDLCQARDLVCSQNTSQMTSSTLAKAADCCVCWTEDAAPVRTACGHVYCHECFDNGCAAPAPGEAEFTLLCHSLACGRRLPLRDLQEHLSSAAFEDLLAHSFATFVQRHPDQLRFCPTPDCGHIYRLLPSSSSSSSESSRSHTCANCLQVTCAACAEPHDGAMTCGDYRDLRSGGHAAFQRLKKELGVKDCPKCGIAIEKVTGCNHMICIACRAHICWVCLSTFSSGDLVYTHMQRIHGGHIDLP